MSVFELTATDGPARAGRAAQLVLANSRELGDERLAWRAAPEQRRDAREVRLVLVEDRRELPLAAVAPEVPPFVGVACRHRISIASPKE